MRPSRSAVRRLDVSRLPADVVALLDALGPDDKLVITRDGASIATVAPAPGVLSGTVTAAEAPAEARPEPREPNATVVVTPMKLSRSARNLLARHLGPDYIVLDLEDAPPTADVLLVAPISMQLLGILRERFPAARVIVAEFEDEELGIDYRGPVRRLLDHGVETYLASATLPELAHQLGRAVEHGPELTGGHRPRLEIGDGPWRAPRSDPDRPDRPALVAGRRDDHDGHGDRAGHDGRADPDDPGDLPLWSRRPDRPRR